MIGQPHPGLVSREVIASDGEIATVREVWDLKVPECPMVLFRRPQNWKTPSGTRSDCDLL
jgi:hypothetical protein